MTGELLLVRDRAHPRPLKVVLSAARLTPCPESRGFASRPRERFAFVKECEVCRCDHWIGRTAAELEPHARSWSGCRHGPRTAGYGRAAAGLDAPRPGVSPTRAGARSRPPGCGPSRGGC